MLNKEEELPKTYSTKNPKRSIGTTAKSSTTKVLVTSAKDELQNKTEKVPNIGPAGYLPLALEASPQNETPSNKLSVNELKKVWEGRKEECAIKDNNIVATQYPRASIGTASINQVPDTSPKDELPNKTENLHNTDSTKGTQNVGRSIVAGLSSIHLASTSAVNCVNCSQPTKSCKHGEVIDNVPHVGLKFYNVEFTVITVTPVTQPHRLLSSDEYEVEMKTKNAGNIFIFIYPRELQSHTPCPRVGDTIFFVQVVESVRPSAIKNSYLVKFRGIDHNNSHEEEYPDYFKKYYKRYYCR